MSTAGNPTPTSPDATGASSPSPAPITSPPASAPTGTPPASEPWRAPDTAPAWAKGKTPDELLADYQRLYSTFERTISGNAPAPAPAPAYQAPPPPAIGDDDYVSGAALRQYAPQYVQQAVAPQLQQMQSAIAQTNLETIKRDPKCAEIFQKYGPEVYNRLGSVDKSYWNVDNLRTIVNLVKADHVEEIARDMSARLATEQMETLRSSGAGFPSVPQQTPKNTLQSDSIPSEWKKRAAEAGITEQTVQEFCRAADISPDDFFAQFGNTVVTEVKRG